MYRIIQIMFLQVSLIFLGNGIESIRISMSVDTITRDIYMLCFATEPFLIYIPVIKFKLVVVIDVILKIDNPGRVLKTINIRTITVK